VCGSTDTGKLAGPMSIGDTLGGLVRAPGDAVSLVNTTGLCAGSSVLSSITFGVGALDFDVVGPEGSKLHDATGLCVGLLERNALGSLEFQVLGLLLSKVDGPGLID